MTTAAGRPAGSEKCVAVVEFTCEVLLRLAQGRYEVVENAVPDGAVPIAVHESWERGTLAVKLCHPSFAVVREGERCPVLPPPVIRRLDADQMMMGA